MLPGPRRLLGAAVDGVKVVGVAICLARFGLIVLTVLLLGCMLGAVSPALDRLNHLQPLIVLATLAVLLFARIVGEQGNELSWYAFLLAVNVMLFLAPVLRLPAAAPGDGEQIRIMTFNYLYWQQRHQDVASFIRQASPDVIVLQELTSHGASQLANKLEGAYPYRRFCACDVAIWSKRPLENVREPYDRRGDVPPMLVATVRLANGRPLHVAGVHLHNPSDALRQQRQLQAVARELGTIRHALVLAGDFNLTPWSWSLNRFAAGLALNRHTGLQGTWSTSLSQVLPWFPIDHVLSTRDLGLVAIERGPKLGSDHLPVIATLALSRL